MRRKNESVFLTTNSKPWTRDNEQAGENPDFIMNNIENWVEITHEKETFFTNILDLPKEDKFRKSVETGTRNWTNQESVLALYNEPRGKRLQLNFIPFHGVESIEVIGIHEGMPSKGWQNIIDFIEDASSIGNKLKIIFYTPCVSDIVVIRKTQEGFSIKWGYAGTSHELQNKTELLACLIGTGHDGSGGRMVPVHLEEHFGGIPNMLRTKTHIRAYSEEVCEKKLFARRCGKQALKHNIPFEMLLKMECNVEIVNRLVDSLEKVQKVEDADIYAFRAKTFTGNVFKKYGIECPKGMITKVAEPIFCYLKEREKISNRYNTIAIKNSKGESPVLSTSAFFKTDGGLIIVRGRGTTHRRRHQGTNRWNLFTIEGLLPQRSGETRNESWVDFGRRNGEETNISWLYESDLIPISCKEWEELVGREFIAIDEFSWFNSGVGIYGLEDVYNHNSIEFISTLQCYESDDDVLIVENKEEFLFEGAICSFSGSIDKTSWFKTVEKAHQQAELVGNAIVLPENDGLTVYGKKKIDPVEIRVIPGETDGYLQESKFGMGVNPSTGWHKLVSRSGFKGLASGYLDSEVAVWKDFIGSFDVAEIKDGKIITIAKKIA